MTAYLVKGTFVLQRLLKVRVMRYVKKEISMTGKRFLSLLTSKGIPASCFAQRLGCHLSSIKKLQSCEKVPHHYINMLIREFGMYLTGNDLEMLNGA